MYTCIMGIFDESEGRLVPSVMFLNAFSDCVKLEILNPNVLNLDNEGL